MNLPINIPKQCRGSVLLATVVVMGIISLALGSYLSLVATQNRTVVSALTWNTALPYAEAGVEEALTHIYRSGGSNFGANGWAAVGTNWTRTNAITDGSYRMSIAGDSTKFTVVATGTAPRIGMPGDISRTVRVTATRRPRFMGIVALDSFRISGNALFDSYDSSDPSYSTNGMYDPRQGQGRRFCGYQLADKQFHGRWQRDNQGKSGNRSRRYDSNSRWGGFGRRLIFHRQGHSRRACRG
ncbi:MAG: hypothetical protein HC814_05600 [Rhodobacteraceae bacterium]|nr:hypothetical protein [Paracoccaceae bacterium]